MGAWDVVNTLVAFVSRFPVERLIPQRTSDKDLEELAKRIGISTPQAGHAVNPPQFEAAAPEDSIRGGTAGSLCSDEHLTQCASNIREAWRMAQSRGVKDRQVRDRLKAARSELEQMERWDIVPEKIATYPQEHAETARWLLPKSSAIRHIINEILMRDKTIQDLEKLSVLASSVASELTDRIDSLPKDQKASDACLEIKRLPQFLEEMKKGGHGTQES
jgi:hypothetical protein